MAMSKRRIFVTFIAIFVCFVLQTTLVHKIALGSIIPNLLIILTSAIGFMRGNKEGMFTGFICGLLIDIFYSSFMGYQAFIYMLIGYFNGYFKIIFYDEDSKLPLFLIGSSEFIYGIIIYIFSFLLRAKLDFVYYLLNIILPELLYTFLVSILFYPVILKINCKLENYEKRRTN